MKRFVAFFLIFAFAGCGEIPSGDGSGSAKSPAEAGSKKGSSENKTDESSEKKQPEQKPPLRTAFADVDDALNTLAAALAQQYTGQDQVREASEWLVGQGAPAVAPLEKVMNDDGADLALRVCACRILGDIGPPAESVLLSALSSNTKMVRMKSVEKLGQIEPAGKQTIATLIELLDDQDDTIRRLAIHALGDIGQPAKEAAPRLQAIRNSVSDNESVRAEADRAIKLVEPRRTLPTGTSN